MMWNYLTIYQDIMDSTSVIDSTTRCLVDVGGGYINVGYKERGIRAMYRHSSRINYGLIE